MSWYQLLSIWRENKEYERQEKVNPPMACPNDGEPLQTDPNGRLRCPFDGWIWRGYNT